MNNRNVSCGFTSRFAAAFYSIAMIAAILLASQLSIVAAAGALDNSLDGNGKLATDLSGSTDVVTDVLVQPDGKIVVAGVTGGFQGNPAVVRYNVNGSLDTTFGGGDGRVILPNIICSKALVTRDSIGRLIIATCNFSPNTISDFHLFRLTSSGELDDDFDSDGRTDIQFLPQNFRLGDVTVDSTNRIIVASGTAGAVPGGPGPLSNWWIYRFNTTGSLDTGFDGDGRVETDFGGNSSEYAVGVAVLPNGRILAGGSATPGSPDFALALYTVNGSLDTNWGGGDGKVVTDLSANDVPVAMKVSPDGKIAIGGTSIGVNGTVPTLLRYNADGTTDNTFDNDGFVQDATLANIQSMAIQIDGKIVTVGKKINASNDFIVARRNPNGSPDALFGTGGVVMTDMNNGSDDDGKAVGISFDRRIIVAGSTLNTTVGSSVNFCVARYLPTNRSYRAPFDFDEDGKSDYGIFRPANGQWWVNLSSTRTPFNSTTMVHTFGNASNRLAPLDFTGDGKADVAFWRPQTGEWFVLRSENFSFYAFPFGAPGDFAVPGDYDADGKADAAVFRPTTSTWYLSQSGGGPTQFVQFGLNGDRPVVADYDEDGRSDIAIFRPGPREWWIQRSTAGILAMQFGNVDDKPVQGDYTGDGKADVAIFRPSNGEWYIVRSDDLSFYGFPFGAANDVPAPADYDGDGRFDPTVVRGTQWFVAQTTGGTQIFNFGAVGDRPIANAFVP